MGDNVYIAYVLWLLTGRFGGHRFYPGKFASGFAMTALFFIGYSLAWAVASCFFSRFFVQTFCNLQARAGAAVIRSALYGYGSIKSTIGGNEK